MDKLMLGLLLLQCWVKLSKYFLNNNFLLVVFHYMYLHDELHRFVYKGIQLLK